jgi:outer membrane protein assembly factor BamB
MGKTAAMRRLAALLAVPVLVVTACSGSSAAVTSRGVSPSHSTRASRSAAAGSSGFSDWPTYHRTDNRSGQSSRAISGQLHRAWAKSLDGAVYGEPLVVHGMLIVATENDTVYGLAPRSGRIRWHRHLGTPVTQGLPCGDVNPLGITGTPAYDARTGSVFVVAETVGGNHTLWALSAETGRRRWHRSLDVLPNRERIAEQQRSALLVAAGRVITAFGGLYGDCANYVGYITSTSTTGKGRTTHFAIPTPREAGMWSPAGPVIGENGNVYVASGNGSVTQGRWDGSDSVTELAPVSMHRVAAFAPSTWRQDNASDADLGSSSPIPISGRIVIAGKTGTVYLLRQSLGGVGGQLTTVSGCSAYGGAAHVGSLAIMPCSGGIRALIVGRHSLRWEWTAAGVYGSPVVAGNRVYVADRDSGDVKVLSLGTGNVLRSVTAGSLEHFPSEVVDGGWVFVPTTSGITALRGS